MKVTYRIEVGLKRPRRGGIDGVEMVAKGEIPFVPPVGMMLVPIPHDDFREVERAYWRVTEPDEIEVYFAYDEGNTVEALERFGWKEEP
ncbi:MAG: hypothetical protein ABMA13_22910 [Chthoniobacteraceae bacterium]